MRDDGAHEGMGLDAFLGHRSQGGSDFLGNWKKSGSIVLWLHTKSTFHALWSHNWPRVVERTNRDSGEKTIEIWGGRFVCHERELILKKQRYRDDGTGERDYPPEVCPICILTEHVRSLVDNKEIEWTAPVFQFEGDDPDRNLTLRAGGIYNAFSKKDITNEEKAQLRRAGIRRDEAWRENLVARLQYVFSVVDDSDPGGGVQTAIEASTLGDKMKLAIKDEMRRRGKAEGNPMLNPYAFEWQYAEKEVFDKKYHVLCLPDEPTPEVLNLITETDAPDLSDLTMKGNCRSLRAEMEEHAVIKLPWDDIFGPAEKRGLLRGEAPKPKGRTHEVAEDDEAEAMSRAQGDPPKRPDFKKLDPKAASKPNTQSKPEAKAKENPLDDRSDDGFAASFETLECDHCEKPIGPDDFECSHCHAEYEEDKAGEIHLSKRPCGITACGGKAPVLGTEGNRTICEKCGSIYSVDPWKLIRSNAKKEEPQTPPTRGRTRRMRGAAPRGDAAEGD